jgi:Leucine-rich repeat (LRR) protein
MKHFKKKVSIKSKHSLELDTASSVISYRHQRDTMLWLFIFAIITAASATLGDQLGKPPCPTRCQCDGVLTKVVECNGNFSAADWRKLGEELDTETTAQIVIGYANFTFLQLDNFPTIPRLTHLRILAGRIATFPKGLPVKFPQLKFLFLQFQKIRYIPKIALKGLKNVANLDLNGNQLTRISANNFEHLINLKILNLNENRISCLERNAFSEDLDSLGFISLARNCISVLPIGVFDSLSTFGIVNLEGNQIQTIRKGNFKPIFVLILKNNCIETIEDGAFDGFRTNAVNLQSNPVCMNPVSNFILGNLKITRDCKAPGNFKIPTIPPVTVDDKTIVENQQVVSATL